MPRPLFTGVVLLLLVDIATTQLGPPRVVDESASVYRTVRALCIGCGRFEASSISELPYASKDARDVASLLREHYGFEVHALVDAQATRRAILEAIDSHRADLGPDDAFILFFSGHGATVLTDPDTLVRSGFLIPHDARIDPTDTRDAGEWAREAIAMKDVATALRDSPARHTLMIADACYSGFLGKGIRGSGVDSTLKRLLRERSRLVITAGTEVQPSLEDSEIRQGVFTHALLAELRSDDARSAMEVFLALRRAVARASGGKMMPQYRELAAENGEFVFVPRSVRDVPERMAALGQRHLKRKGIDTELVDLYRVVDAQHAPHGIGAARAQRTWRGRVKRFEECAALGDPIAMAALHYCHKFGLGTDENETAAYHWARLAYDTGHPAGYYTLAHCYLYGIGRPKNATEGERLLAIAEEADFPLADVHHAWRSLRYRDKWGADAPALVSPLQQLEESGFHHAGFILAAMHLMRLPGVPFDPKRAGEILARGAVSGHPPSCLDLAKLHKLSPPGFAGDLKRGRMLLRRASDGGEPQAQFMLACARHQAGDFAGWGAWGFDQDFERARELALVAERRGVTEASVLLADVFYHGRGTQPDWTRARLHCDRAFNANLASAIRITGHWHFKGDVLARDHARALQLFQRAGKLGDAEALYMAGRCYDEVLGLDLGGHSRRDMREPFRPYALNWYVRAAALGHAGALQKLRTEDWRDALQRVRRDPRFRDTAAEYDRLMRAR